MRQNPAPRAAILGGSRAVTVESAPANRWPILTEEDEAAVLSVLRDGELSLHPVTEQLEADYRALFGVRHALAHCNGTAALLAAFFALGLQPGDEVLAPSATHWASVVPMMWLGALPVFCESEVEQLGLDPEDAERKVTERTRAMVIVHLWGMPSKVDELVAVARRHGLKIVEDASHAHGARWQGRWCGTLGDIGVFSLQSSKLAPAGEGGILLTNDDGYFERAVCLGDIARILALEGPSRRFAGTSFGMKTRMAPLSAAVGRVQLRHLLDRNAQRTANLRYLSEQLEALGMNTFLPPVGIERVYFEFIVHYDAARWGLPVELLVEALQHEGCDVAAPRYPLLHQQPLFTEGRYQEITRLEGLPSVTLPTYRADALPMTEAANHELLRLPSFPTAGRRILDEYALAFRKVLSQAKDIRAAAGTRAPGLVR